MTRVEGDVDTAEIMDQPQKVLWLRNAIDSVRNVAVPLIDLYRPYVDGLENLPRDGRFLLVGNHTQSGIEGPLIPHYVWRELGMRVRPLTERMIGRMPGAVRDLFAAYGAVIGSRENARELMRHNQPILVFPGGGREVAKFKNEQYQLRWGGRFGFSRLAVENNYPIVPVALVGGDDVYRSLIRRESFLGQLTLKFTEKVLDRRDNPLPIVRGIGPTLIPRPQRMYLRFSAPIDTRQPPQTSEDDWIRAVKDKTQNRLEATMAQLLEVRASDPYRTLNPLGWSTATTPEVSS